MFNWSEGRVSAFALAVLLLAACGGEDDARPAPTPPGVPTTPDPTPPSSVGPLPAGATNDSLVAEPPVLSFDTATYGVQRRTFQAIPTITFTGNRLWLAYFGFNGLPTGEVTGTYQILVYSDDGGRTWSREHYFVPADPRVDRVGDARLWTAPDGKLWMFYFQSGDGQTIDQQNGAWVTIIDSPEASEPQFGRGFWFGDGIVNRPFRYQGDWLVPLDYVFYNKPRQPQRAGQHLYRIDWMNRRFTYVTTLPRNLRADFNEPALVELRDGSLLLSNRSHAGNLISRTIPGTWRWSTAEPFNGFPTDQTRTALQRSPSGRLVLVTNKSNVTRENMTIALSNDEGQTWPHQYTFDIRPGTSYPDIAFAPNGDILVAYDFGRYWGAILLARFNEESLVRGEPQPAPVLVSFGQGKRS
ncbi:sialidase family protein [Croceibacterium mercuriale]|uniref:sialidase family protein n=1 Tax=Croceibacterium mercuriale TaxID=1572751 RepID=UPI0012698A1A|nr:sialidase family protein [Croceibacterium mercuriale]